ncbi:MAG: MarR family transcriptional regulator [Bacteroidota bacterium]
MDKSKLTTLASNIISLKPVFFKTLGKVVPHNSSITPGAFYGMLFLKRHGLLSMTELGRLLSISKPNVTAMVNKLIENGLVLRSMDAHDRRIIMVSLSLKGHQFVDKHNQKYLFQIQKKLTLLTDSELDKLSDSIQNVKDILLKLSEAESN